MVNDSLVAPLPAPSVVFCWELGGGLGHLTKAVLLAESLLDRGCRVAFMLRELGSVDDLLPREAYRVLQAPVSWGAPAGWPAPADHAELLLHAGFADGPGLRSRVRAWGDAFTALQADLIVADHAPTAVLAARCAGLPTVLFGGGFFAPPPPWPVFRHWEDAQAAQAAQAARAAPAARRAQARELVAAQVDQCLRSHGKPALAALPELLTVQRNFLLTVPELDPYPRDPGEPSAAGVSYCGCVCIDDVGGPPPWPAADGPRVFAYLRPQLEGLDEVLAALSALAAGGAAVLVRAAGLDDPLRARWAGPRLVFSAALLRLADVARDAALVLCSGSDTAHGMALRGVPVLALPMNAEQRLAAERLQATGAGAWRLPGTDRSALGAVLAELLHGTEARAAARALATRHGPPDNARVIGRIADECLALLGRSPRS